MDKNAMDIDGRQLPTLVYMAREKRPQCPHNFKAGAMNALVSFKLPYMGRIQVKLSITFVYVIPLHDSLLGVFLQFHGWIKLYSYTLQVCKMLRLLNINNYLIFLFFFSFFPYFLYKITILSLK